LFVFGHILPAILLAFVFALMTVVAFGFRLFDSTLTGLGASYGTALLLIALGGYVISERLLPASWGMLALATCAIGVCVGAAAVEAVRAVRQQNARVTRLTALGRWSSYMAHDFKNPLTALKGAAQFLQEERAQGRSIDAQHEFLALLVSESDRLAGLVERYQHFGATEALKQPTSLNGLVAQVLAPMQAALPANVTLQLALDDSLCACSLDPQLTHVALENVVRNALEAMPRGGTLTVRTTWTRARSGPPAPSVSVEDTGRGMNPRELSLAFDDFFSTKEPGRGLGLAMVKRVLEAHGGSVRASSRLGQGTCITLRFPV
jgi:signal transduction histidine kinase